MTKVNCFCSGTTFPHGEATNNRIIMIGKALIATGVDFDVYLNSEGNKNKFNDKVVGEVDGINFNHLNSHMAIDLSKVKRILNFYWSGFLNTWKTLKKISKSDNSIIYLYSHGSIYNLWVSWLAHMYQIPVVQEVNEWTEAVDDNRVQSFIYKKVMFRWAKGAIVISNNILEQINKYKKASHQLSTTLIPVLADKSDWSNHVSDINKTFVWCGLVEGYFNDVVFLIESFALLCKQYPDYKLVICGKYRAETKQKISALLESLGVDVDCVKLTGFISNEELVLTCQTATALLVPLWNDQRSAARFPTKVASFLFSGRPVLTCQVGEVGNLLSDSQTAIFFESGDKEMLKSKMGKLINDSELATTIGENGKTLALQKFDNQVYGALLKDFFNNLNQKP